MPEGRGNAREAGSQPAPGPNLKRPFTADGRLFRLAAEAERIRLAPLFDPCVAVHASRIEPLPHQITAVYGEMLPRQPLRFLLADDPGAGKTIMAGLLIRELMLRGDLERCLVVAPGSLVEQWQDELESKFDLAFDLLTRERIEAAGAGGNPFTESSHLIARLDVLSRSEDLRRRLEAAKEWDLVVCDEAHRMAASYFGTEVRYTKRYRLGRLLGARCRHFLLMTATPHNGKEEDFQLFMALLDPDRFEGRFRGGRSRSRGASRDGGAPRVGRAHRGDGISRSGGAHRGDGVSWSGGVRRDDGASRNGVGDLLRRLTKEELLRFDGRPLFPERRAHTVHYALSGGEAALYAAVTDYVRKEMDRAERFAARDEKRRRNVGFALQILQRRLASSPAAVHESLRRRREKLEARLAHLLAGAGRDTVRTGRDADSPMHDPDRVRTPGRSSGRRALDAGRTVQDPVRTGQGATRTGPAAHDRRYAAALSDFTDGNASRTGQDAVRTRRDTARTGRDPHDLPRATALAGSSALAPAPPAADFDPDDLEEAAQEDVDAIEARVLGHATTAETVAEFEAEIDSLRRLEDRARALRREGTDTKWLQLASLLDHPLMTGADGRRRKLIVFTEPRDTLEYLAGRIRTRLGRDEAVVVIHGGVGRADRRKVVEAFMHDPQVAVMVANDAAGEGVNLQRAHLMVNYDLPWNPNRLEQRFGRIHRIGQTEVCHLWNLVAKDTREGEVYGRLLEKLEAARSALGGRVYDVLGRLFEGAGMRDLLMDAIRYGERPEVKARLFERVDGAADRERLLALLEDRALARDRLGAAEVGRIREEMERAEARRLQPHYIESFFLQAFRHLGGSVHRREAGRYEITRVPGPIRRREPRAGCAGPVLERYERICFEKSKIAGGGATDPGMGSDPGLGSGVVSNLGSRPDMGASPDTSSNPNLGPSADPDPGSGASPGPPAAVCLSPGHPLLDATVDLVLERYRGVLAEGAVLVDESDEAGESEAIRALFHFEIAVRDGHERRPGHPRIVSRELRFVEVDADADVDTTAGPGANVDPDVDTNTDADADVDTDTGPGANAALDVDAKADADADVDTEADVNADAGHADAGPDTRSVRDAGPAPYLDYRPIEDDERAAVAARLEAARSGQPDQSGQPVRSDRPDQPSRPDRDLEDVAITYAHTHLASDQIEEVRARRLPEIDRVEAEVTARLKREIVFWDNRALRLRDDERAGKAAGPVSAARAVARADELADRLACRRAEMARERDLAPLAPVVRGRALVVPIGLLRRAVAPEKARLGVRETMPAGRAEVERLAMEAVMAAERALGHEPRDVSAAKVGYDVESREAKTGRLRFIEVKGRAGDADTVTVTHQEIRTALNKPDAFILAIVRVRDGYVSGPHYLRRPFRAEPDFDAVSVTYNLRELLARAEAPR